MRTTRILTLTLATLLGTLGLASCGEQARKTYACSTTVTVGGEQPTKLTDFAHITRPRGVDQNDWKQLIIERTKVYSNTLLPGEKVKLPTPCKKG